MDFLRIADDLVVELKITEVLICCQVKTRAARISAKYTAKLYARHTRHFTGLVSVTCLIDSCLACLSAVFGNY